MKNKILISGVVAGVLGLALHVFIGGKIGALVSDRMQGLTVAQPPYSATINALAVLTSILPGIGIALAFCLMRDRLPGKNSFQKGLCFGFLLLLLKGQLLRAPLMDLAVGNPIIVVLLQCDPSVTPG